MARASDTLMGAEPPARTKTPRAKDVIGGLHGELSTSETMQARAAFSDYKIGGGTLQFADWVDTHWRQ